MDAPERDQRSWVLRVDRTLRAMTTLFFVLLMAASILYLVRLWAIASPALF